VLRPCILKPVKVFIVLVPPPAHYHPSVDCFQKLSTPGLLGLGTRLSISCPVLALYFIPCEQQWRIAGVGHTGTQARKWGSQPTIGDLHQLNYHMPGVHKVLLDALCTSANSVPLLCPATFPSYAAGVKYVGMQLHSCSLSSLCSTFIVTATLGLVPATSAFWTAHK